MAPRMITQMQSRMRAARVTIMVIALQIACLGCAAIPHVLQGLALGAQTLGHVLDAADLGAGKFYARHPSLERQAAVADRLLDARQRVVRCDQAIESRDVDRARKECDGAVDGYRDLYELLDSMGVLDGVCRDCGGAEADAPEPGPLVLPTPGEMKEALGG